MILINHHHLLFSIQNRWSGVHLTSKEWVSRMTTLVECWNKLEGNVGELSSWVESKDPGAPEDGGSIPIEKLEGQLNQLKIMFAEKQKLVNDLEALGPNSAGSAVQTPVPESTSAPVEEAPAAEVTEGEGGEVDPNAAPAEGGENPEAPTPAPEE